MRDFNLRIFDPPKSIQGGEGTSIENIVKSAPVAALFTGKDALTEICRLYGYSMLLGQNLEFELRECLLTMEFSLALRGIPCRFKGDVEKVTFEKLIDKFALQVNTAHAPSQEFVDELHKARRLRNELAHGFLSPAVSMDYLSTRGQESVIRRLKAAEEVFFPLICVVAHLGRGYAADYGVTQEFIEKRRKAWEEEERRIEASMKELTI